jgi:predicted phage baseplate assembly protein
MPEMTRLILNTVIASQTFTLENEILGSSNGKPRQQFSTARRPVLGDLYLEVREPDMPGPEELISIRADYGADATRPITDAQGTVEAVWVRWHEVPNWLSSTYRDRHFLVDRETGQITFGDNIHGRVPPPGANNVQLRRYQTGGGAGGNKPRRVIEQLRATVPYVDKVTNPEPAHGGQDLEDWDSVCERGSRWLRHRDRAVTAEDYEDLAKFASPIVAQAKCYPAQDRALDPLGKGIPRPGMVSVVVVPRGTDSRPQPDLELLRRVRDFLGARSTPEANLVVLAPEYVRICVDAEVVAQSAYMGASVKTRCEEKLMQFLHPVTGGERSRGWEFGARPRESDLYAQLEAVEGLSYVRSLEIHLEEDRPGLGESGSFLISSGEHRIRLAP